MPLNTKPVFPRFMLIFRTEDPSCHIPIPQSVFSDDLFVLRTYRSNILNIPNLYDDYTELYARAYNKDTNRYEFTLLEWGYDWQWEGLKL